MFILDMDVAIARIPPCLTWFYYNMEFRCWVGEDKSEKIYRKFKKGLKKYKYCFKVVIDYK